MFTSLSSDLDKLVLSQHQIVTFCHERREWLQWYNGYVIFFLLKEGGKFFVVYVSERSSGLSVYVTRLEDVDTYCIFGRAYVVYPQLSA
jgi:hypothetical protein